MIGKQHRDSEWVPMALGELCAFRAGSVFTPAFQGRITGDYPFIKVSDMNLPANAVCIQDANNWVSQKDLYDLRAQLLPPGTVVFAKIGEALRQNRRRRLVRETIIDNNLMGAVPCSERVNPLFLYYALSQFSFSEVAQGTALPYLTVATLSDLRLSVPPLPEQHAIAHILATLDDKIELNRRVNETLEAMARALFKSWFVDFDPVRAKVALRNHAAHHSATPSQGGRDWSVERARAYLDRMDPEIAALFPDRFVDSELGEMPEGWEVKTLGEAVEVVGGTTPSTKVAAYWDGGKHNWATPKDLSSLSAPVLLDTERKITDAGLAKIGSGLLPPDTLLLSSRAPIGYLAISAKPVAVNQGFIAMPPGDMASSQFLLYWCSTFHDEIINHANGSTFLEISKGNFRRIPLVLPDKEVMIAFGNYARQFHQRIVSGETESRALVALHDALLPRLISGDLRVGHPMSQAN